MSNHCCLVCGKDLWFTSYPFVVAKVDDGRPPATPNRWRKVGYVCDGECNAKFEADPYKHVKSLDQDIEWV